MGPATSIDRQQELTARLRSARCSVVGVCIGVARCDNWAQIGLPGLDLSTHISEEYDVGQLTGRGFDDQDHETATLAFAVFVRPNQE